MTLSKINVINNTLADIRERIISKEFNGYIDLYKYLVKFEISVPFVSDAPNVARDEERIQKWKEVTYLEDYFSSFKKYAHSGSNSDNHSAHSTQNHFFSIFINKDVHWLYAEILFSKTRPRYRELVKLYIPVEPQDALKIARQVFDHLNSLHQTFLIKVSYQDRYDTICIWITRSELDKVVDYIGNLKKLLMAPLFTPEYKTIGVTREMDASFNEAIASTLYRYLGQREAPHLRDYINFLKHESAHAHEVFARSYCLFDRSIILRSLQCIEQNRCPVNDAEFNVIDFNCED